MIYAGSYTDANGHRWERTTYGRPNNWQGPVVAARRKHTSASAAQTACRNAMKTIAQAWHALTLNQRQLWNAWAGTHSWDARSGFPIPLNGWSAYANIRLSAIRCSAPWQTGDPVERDGIIAGTLTPRANEAGSTVSFTWPNADPYQGGTYSHLAAYQVPPTNAFDWTDPTATKLAYTETPWPNNNAIETFDVPCLYADENLWNLRFYIRNQDNDFAGGQRICVADSVLLVTGTTNPDCTGAYYYDPNPPPSGYIRGFWRGDNAYCLFRRSYAGGNYWFLADADKAYTPVTKHAWQNYPDGGYLGTYSPMTPHTGSPAVA